MEDFKGRNLSYYAGLAPDRGSFSLGKFFVPQKTEPFVIKVAKE